MKKENEKNACEAFISILHTLTGIQYIKRGSPDEVNRKTSDVDFLIVSIDNESDVIAVEHTILESFEEQIEYVNRSYDVVDSINADCRKRIPTDRYYFLSIPHIVVNSLVGRSRSCFVNDLSSWVTETAQSLLIDSYRQINYKGHNITLMCSGTHPQFNGNVWRAPQQPENHENMQTQRLSRAIGDKLPKLRQYKSQGFKTALLLESIATIPSTITQRGNEMSSIERSTIKSTIDYIVVFGSNKSRMIVGSVWKEKSIWYSSIPNDRRFSF